MSYKYKAVRLEDDRFIIVDIEVTGDMWASVVCEGKDGEEGIAWSSLVVSSLNNAPRFEKKLHDLLKKKKEGN